MSSESKVSKESLETDRNHRTALLDDSELQGLSLYEKKSLLINRQIDILGFGRYQWCIFFLCGFGYFLDLMWANVFGIVAPVLQTELGFTDGDLGNIFTAFNAGLCAGAGFWGIMVDIIGRQWAFNLTVLISSIFGLCLGVPDNYTPFLVLTAFVGFGIGGNVPIDTTITLEFLPQNKRWMLATLSIFQPLGVVLSSGLAFAFIPPKSCPIDTKSCKLTAPGETCCSKAENYGWRYLMFTTGAITLAVFLLRFVVFTFKESPKFLIAQGRDEEAVDVLNHIAKFNKSDSSISIEDFRALSNSSTLHRSSSYGTTDEPIEGNGSQTQAGRVIADKVSRFSLGRLKLLFANATMTRLTILTFLTYIFDYWGFTIAGSFLPTILARKGGEAGQTFEDTYRQYIIIYVWGIPAVIAASFLIEIPYLGRKWVMVISSALMALSLFLFTVVKSQTAYVAFNAFEYAMQSLFNAVLYGWTPEAFPAPVRGTASGMASFWGRLSAIIAPIIGAHLLNVDGGNGVLYLAGAGTCICVICTAFLPIHGNVRNSQSL